MSDWFSSSYMARRGVARGWAGKTHHLTEAKQGSYQYVYGPYAPPILSIAPGEVVVAETLDAFGGAIKSVDDKPSEKLKFPFVNPQNGPIAVEGAEPGDVLCVRIETIAPRGPQPVGTSALIPEFGGLVGNAGTPMLNPPLPERVMKYHVTESGVRFNDKIVLPFEPFIGTLGVSPQIEAVLSLQPDYWGGNMACPMSLQARSPISRCKRKGQTSFSVIATADRATANSAASPSRSHRRRQSKSISSSRGRSTGRGSRTSASS
jgi:amidase